MVVSAINEVGWSELLMVVDDEGEDDGCEYSDLDGIFGLVCWLLL